MLIHKEALELAKNAAAAGDGVPFAISCVKVDVDGAVTVTDGAHWLRMQAAADEPSLFDELAEEDTKSPAGPVLVPAEVMSAFRAAMKKRKSKKTDAVAHVVVAQQENRVTLRSSDGKTMRTFLLEAMGADLKFPDVDRIVLAYKPVRHVTLSVELLRVILRTLHACKVGYVKLGFPEDAMAPISLSAWSETGPITGQVMPSSDQTREQADPEIAAAAKRLDAVGSFTGQKPGESAADYIQRTAGAAQVRQPSSVIELLKESIDQVTGEISGPPIPDGLQKAIDNLLTPSRSGAGLTSISVGGKITRITPEIIAAARKRKASRKKGAKA